MCEQEIDTSDKVSKSGGDGGRPVSVAATRARRPDVLKQHHCAGDEWIVCLASAIQDTGNVY